ncbi:MAG: hypothetical protein ABSA53_37275 [Streptosporangiaceae bacterium]
MQEPGLIPSPPRPRRLLTGKGAATSGVEMIGDAERQGLARPARAMRLASSPTGPAFPRVRLPRPVGWLRDEVPA